MISVLLFQVFSVKNNIIMPFIIVNADYNFLFAILVHNFYSKVTTNSSFHLHAFSLFSSEKEDILLREPAHFVVC
jgi:hypothetical protein